MQKCRCEGFTLLELIVVIVIVSFLATALLDRMRYYQEQAEKAAMVQTVGIVRSALHLKLAELISRGRMQEIAKLVQANPMDWLAQLPENYLGEYYAPEQGEVPPGSWYFDRKDHTLVYWVDRGEHFKPGPDGRKHVRYRLKLVYGEPLEKGGAEREVNGLILAPTEPYHWF